MPKALLLSLVALAAFQVRSDTPAEAPAIRHLVQAYAVPALGSCVFDAKILQPVSTGLAFEVSFSLTQKHGECVFEFYATGMANGVRVPSEPLERALADHDTDVYNKIHSHPMSNVGYFAEGSPYDYEVMFADEDMIHTRQLPRELVDRLAQAVQRGDLPGYSLSPPSVQDFNGASTLWSYTEKGPKKILSRVISSGGVWTYAIEGEAQAKKARQNLEYLVAYALQHEMAHTERAPEARRERARRLFEAAWESEEWGPIFRVWQETGFELRAPYSREAALAWFERGDKSAIEAEFARKLEQAKKLCELLHELGIEASFEPFAEHATPRT